ncbi:MAG: ABC transporter ATP-binding protein [Pseudobdellovibrionaceae bacterium]|nr:ABC transporter ATP-binding protein [Bdellovibrionales bacterium]USN48900.1 MAG: ABC transporter ATP-binding protein [Pseudobdellovibrionaceae bacterium]
MSEVLIQAKGVKKVYSHGGNQLTVVQGIDLMVHRGDALCILGPSGAGKSTLLHMLGGLDKPSLGQVIYQNENLFKKTDDELAHFRNRSVGFVFQFHHLLKEFTALENVAMPARIGGVPHREARRRAEELLGRLGLSDRKTHYPTELSGGEQQRVAIARALVQKPEVLMADEPTGNLDTENSRNIQKLFFELKEQMGLTLVVVTHDQNFASLFPRQMTLKDGRWSA